MESACEIVSLLAQALKSNMITQIFAKEGILDTGKYNLLEQAMMAQSRRITKEYAGKKITRKALTTLKPEDFDVNASKQIEKETKRTIGFAV